MAEVWKTLSPKNDAVFKLLFADQRNRALLIAFLNAVLRPATPIVEVEVLNPELPKETVLDKGAVLDLRTRTSNDSYTNVEVQLAGHIGFRPRSLLYCTRSYSSQLGRGQSYVELKPVVGIFILDFNELQGASYHGVFRLLEEQSHEPLTDQLVLHFLELRKLPHEVADPAEKKLLSIIEGWRPHSKLTG